MRFGHLAPEGGYYEQHQNLTLIPTSTFLGVK